MISELKDLIKKKGWSNTALAKKLGVSTASVSTYLNEKYEGNRSSFEKKIEALLRIEKERENDQKLSIPFVFTKGSKRIFELIAMAHQDEELAILYGDAGLGKTCAIKQYEKENKGSLLIETDPSFSPRVLLIELCKKLGLAPRRSIHDLMSQLIETLKDSGRLILIDEAELLSYKSLELIRRLHDKAGIPIVLVGMPRLLQNLRGTKGEYRQLYSRIAYKLDLGIKADKEDIKALAQGVLGKLEEESFEAFIQYSSENIRHAIKLFRACERVARLNHCNLSPALIKRASDFLVI